jgi:hypothetical protein
MRIVEYTLSIAAILVVFIATPAHSSIVVTLSGPVADADQIQQTAQTPSIFGGATPTQPAGFGYEIFPVGGGSQTYNALGGVSSFDIGIDTNTTSAQSEVLQLLEVKIDTGFSDYLLSTVSLAAYAATDLVQFHTIINGAVDGQEQMFLITSPVQDPAAVWLFGTALIGFIGLSRRTKV